MAPHLQPAASAQLDELNRKLDRIGQQVDYLAQRQRAWDDLRADLAPVAREAYQALVGELASLEDQVTLEDIFDLGRKLLRNVRTLSALFDQLSSLQGLLEDVRPLSKQVLAAATERLDQLERRGYFTFFGEALRVLDRVVTSFTPEDVRALGDNVAFILQTVRSLTQPDILRLLNSSVSAARRTDIQVPRGFFGLLKALRDDEVRRGLGVALAMLKELHLNGDGEDAPPLAIESNS